ncbi:hypothetical protein Tco_0875302 [Tanacetum coccineum]|uniref:DNA-directed RNA polymerase n=1 Tax=Tanacetum coccineum TaxID=301880 RepID=A0ABQ5BP28_9ASTR
MDNTDPPSTFNPSISFITEKVCKLNSFLQSLNLVPSSSNTQFVCTKENGRDIMFVELIKKYDDSSEEELEEDENIVTRDELGAEYFDKFTTMSELAYHKYLMCAPIPSLFLRNPIIVGGSPLNLKIPRNIGHVHVEKAYIDLNSIINIMTRMQYNWIMRKQLGPREDPEGIRGISNFTGGIRGMHIYNTLCFQVIDDINKSTMYLLYCTRLLEIVNVRFLGMHADDEIVARGPSRYAEDAHHMLSTDYVPVSDY